jgi:lipoyl(octanoyl) transferase
MNQDIEWQISQNQVDFPAALEVMQQRVDTIISGEKKQLIWLLEHSPVYTAGISARDEDLIAKTDIPIFKTNRGGKYTYHGPRMRIIYLMLDLKKFFEPKAPDISRFVEFLESWVIAILAEYGIKGEIRKGRVGIWVQTSDGEKKIAAIGIKVKRWVTYHGIAINLNPDLKAFNNIVPCGIKEFGVTSLADLGVKSWENFDEVVKKKFYETFANTIA